MSNVDKSLRFFCFVLFCFFVGQVQAYLSSLGEEELEEMKNELIFIKNIFIKQEEEEEEMGDAVDGVEEGGGGGGQTKDKGDLSSQLHSSALLCE